MRLLLFPAILVGLRLFGQAPLPYDLDRPDQVLQLPDELLEVSALTDVDEHTVGCVQDEAATFYRIDLRTGTITARLPFGPPGDLEGLTRVGPDYYALRSDGLIYHLRPTAYRMTVVDSFRVDVPEPDLEGLGYDEQRKQVLISPKGIAKGEPEKRDQRTIHAYDVASKRLLSTPALTFSVTDVLRQARTAGFAVPERTTPKGRVVPALKLRFSSVAVDPLTDHFYLLSAVDRTLLVMDRKANVVALHHLPAALYPKPEGITFLPGGALLISNEGKQVRPNLLRFERKR